jgi:hypothetical protein
MCHTIMIKKVLIPFIAIFLLIPLLFYIIHFSYSESIVLSDKKVIYELPYVGMLPDNPLYFIKQIRDKIVELSIRDYQKKADFYLLSSDKQAGIAIQLNKKGKTKQALQALSQAEILSLNIYSLYINSKKQGVTFNESFIYRLKLSNVKHRQVIETFIKELPQGNESEINKIIDLNERMKKDIEKI